jgi:hypothetical protein
MPGSPKLHVENATAQKMFSKHGAEFGLSGNWNPSQGVAIRAAIARLGEFRNVFDRRIVSWPGGGPSS